MRVQDIMTRDLPALSPSDSVRDAATAMADRNVKALPVCDGESHLVGIITDWDVTAAAAKAGDLATVSVADTMTVDVLAARPDATLHEASELMGERRVHHLCVTDDDVFCGIVHLDVDWAQLGANIQAPMATFMAPV